MRTIGFIAVAFTAVGALAVAAFGVKSIPDIRHYRRIQKM
jgi:hypothetical protein